jgi:hypothetical protein
MNQWTLTLAMQEAKRFLFKAEHAQTRIKEDDMALITGAKEIASVKRASLDLTRALAEMRKP